MMQKKLQESKFSFWISENKFSRLNTKAESKTLILKRNVRSQRTHRANCFNNSWAPVKYSLSKRFFFCYWAIFLFNIFANNKEPFIQDVFQFGPFDFVFPLRMNHLNFKYTAEPANFFLTIAVTYLLNFFLSAQTLPLSFTSPLSRSLPLNLHKVCQSANKSRGNN